MKRNFPLKSEIILQVPLAPYEVKTVSCNKMESSTKHFQEVELRYSTIFKSGKKKVGKLVSSISPSPDGRILAIAGYVLRVLETES